MTQTPLAEHVSVFSGSTNVTPVETVPLAAVLERIQNGTYSGYVEQLRHILAAGDEKAYRAAKEQSTAFTPCCAMHTRAKKIPWSQKLISTTGLVYFDLDHLGDPDAVKGQLAQDCHIVFAFVSPSASGLKIGVAASGITGPDDYKNTWQVMLDHLKQTYPGVHLNEDTHVKYLNALCYMSYDPTSYVNSNASPFLVPPPARKAAPRPRPTTEMPDYTRVASALTYIPNTDADYETWLTLGMALHSTGEPWARDLWDWWSRQSGKFDEGKQEKSWQSFSSDGTVTIASLFHQAKQAGWRSPRATLSVKGPRPPTRVVPDMTGQHSLLSGAPPGVTEAPGRERFRIDEHGVWYTPPVDAEGNQPGAPEVTPADVLDQDALLQELAGLPPLDYDRRRDSAAKLLGVRVSTLDTEIAKRRATLEAQRVTERLAAAMPEPLQEAVDGAVLLNDIAAFYTTYMALPAGAADAAACWTLHTYVTDANVITPRLGVVSPQKRCGKTTFMSLLGAVVARALAAAHITRSALFRVIDERRPTILIDEADTFLKDNEELRGVLNAGHYKPHASIVCSVPTGDSWEAKDFSVWAPVAIALIGHLPGTLADRAITIRLRRKTKTEHVERLRLDRLEEATIALRRRCLRWAHDNLQSLTESDPSVPETLHDRAADNWRPLCAIAEIAGGEWPERVTKAIAALAGAEIDDDAIGVMLLGDIRQIFTDDKADDKTEKLFSDTIVKALHLLEERPWSEWGQHRKPMSKTQLAGLLRPFEVKSTTIDIAGAKAKGYHKADFVDAWNRYLPPLPLKTDSQNVTPLQPSNDAGLPALQAVTQTDTRNVTPLQMSNNAGLDASKPLQASNDASVTDQNTRNPLRQNTCNGVTDRGLKNVTDQNTRNPASHKGCNGVTDRGAENGEGERVKVGDWVNPLSTDGVITPDADGTPTSDGDAFDEVVI